MGHSNNNEEVVIPQQFPAGIRVLVVDHDITILDFIKQICIRCHYHVTTPSQALEALNILKEKKGCFDLILVDVHMPDMNGYDFLQQVRQEIEIPVIMMSIDDTPSDIVKAIKYGACDYWIKPLHEEQLRNMWKHVARKALSENKEHEILRMMEVGSKKKRAKDDSGDNNDNNNDAKEEASKELVVAQAQDSVVDETDKEEDNCAPPAKKPRFVWTTELHKEFVKAVKQLGPEQAVPRRIVELMKVPGLTREHVASHLQKFRLYLKKSIEEQQNAMAKRVPETIESNKVCGSGGFDLSSLAAATPHAHTPYEVFTYDNTPQAPPNIARNNFPQSNMILDDPSSRYVAPPSHPSTTMSLQQFQQPVMNVHFSAYNYYNISGTSEEEANSLLASMNSNINPFSNMPQFYGCPPRPPLPIVTQQQLPNSNSRNGALRSSTTRRLSSPPSSRLAVGLEMVPYRNTTMEVTRSVINSPEDDQPFL